MRAYKKAGIIEYSIALVCWAIVIVIATPIVRILVEHYS